MRRGHPVNWRAPFRQETPRRQVAGWLGGGNLMILLFMPRDYAGPCMIGFAIGESLGASALRIAGGIYFNDVVFQGLVMRAAPWEVVNAINQAHVLPVYAIEDDGT